MLAWSWRIWLRVAIVKPPWMVGRIIVVFSDPILDRSLLDCQHLPKTPVSQRKKPEKTWPSLALCLTKKQVTLAGCAAARPWQNRLSLRGEHASGACH